jgi:hypothetical protein
VIWVKREGDAVLFTTTSTRQKARNIARDGRVSLTVLDSDNPYHSIEIRGKAELIPPVDPEGAERFVVRVVPDRVIAFTA